MSDATDIADFFCSSEEYQVVLEPRGLPMMLSHQFKGTIRSDDIIGCMSIDERSFLPSWLAKTKAPKEVGRFLGMRDRCESRIEARSVNLPRMKRFLRRDQFEPRDLALRKSYVAICEPNSGSRKVSRGRTAVP
jgi:hypothetical protein